LLVVFTPIYASRDAAAHLRAVELDTAGPVAGDAYALTGTISR
jgi:hypothetical protein